MEKHFSEDLESFTIQPYRMKRLKPYYDYMSKDRTKAIYDDRVAQVLEAQGISAVESPRSVYEVDKLFSSLAKYAPGRIVDPKRSPELSHGIALARACFKRPDHRLKLDMLPMTFDTVAAVTSNPSGSAGLTAYGSTKAESMVRALERGLQTLKQEKAPEPCLAFARTQFNGKTRLVWGYPYSMTVIEGLVAFPLIQAFKGGTTPMAFAMPSGVLGTKLVVSSYHKKWAYSVDMSAYDASISRLLIHEAFKILHTWFDLEQVEPTTGKTVRDVFRLIERYFISSPIVMPDGHIYKGRKHGVPSGSFFTQIIDSVVNVIIAGTISAKFNLNIDKREVFVLGDDLIMWSNRDIDLDTIARYASDVFSVQFNAEKSQKFRYDEPIHYLGRVWTNGLPDLDLDEIAKRMVFPERFRRYSKDEETAKREVQLLVLSYATVYWTALSIAQKAYGSRSYYGKGGATLDVHTYLRHGEVLKVDPDHQAGLQRYLSKYVHTQGRSEMPHTALLYWL